MNEPGDPRTAASMSEALIALIRAKPVTAGDLEAAAGFALDAVANVLAGRNSVPGRKLLAWGKAAAAGGAIERLDRARQAFLLGALCHILEADDLHRASIVHPGCVVVPVLFTLGAGADGRGALTALLHGFEACTRVGMAVGPAHYRIWHNTATCGPFGSALAAAHLLELDSGQTAHAFGNAGTQSAGLWEFLATGAESKHLHAGRAAEAGVVAAELAALGFTGAPRILEGERGFFRAACPDARPAALLDRAEAPWQVHLTSIKPWPSCRHTHPAIEAALALNGRLRAQGLSTDALRTIAVETYPAALDLCDRSEVESAYAAKFSLQHCVAAALAEGSVAFESFEPAARQRLGAVRRRVEVRAGDPFRAAYPLHWGARVSIALPGGQRLAAETSDAKGDPEAPLAHAELIAKARLLLGHGGVAEPQALIDSVLAMAAGGTVPPLPLQVSEVASQQSG